jgi:hypothetical protein
MCCNYPILHGGPWTSPLMVPGDNSVAIILRCCRVGCPWALLRFLNYSIGKGSFFKVGPTRLLSHDPLYQPKHQPQMVALIPGQLIRNLTAVSTFWKEQYRSISCRLGQPAGVGWVQNACMLTTWWKRMIKTADRCGFIWKLEDWVTTSV